MACQDFFEIALAMILVSHSNYQISIYIFCLKFVTTNVAFFPRSCHFTTPALNSLYFYTPYFFTTFSLFISILILKFLAIFTIFKWLSYAKKCYQLPGEQACKMAMICHFNNNFALSLFFNSHKTDFIKYNCLPLDVNYFILL